MSNTGAILQLVGGTGGGDDVLDDVQAMAVQTATPATPAANHVTEPYFEGGTWKYLDDAGAEHPLDEAALTAAAAASAAAAAAALVPASPTNYLKDDASDTTTGNTLAIEPATSTAVLRIKGTSSRVDFVDTDQAAGSQAQRIIKAGNSIYITSLTDAFANTTDFNNARIYHDGGVQLGAASGGDSGYGILNAKGLDIDGVPLQPYIRQGGITPYNGLTLDVTTTGVVTVTADHLQVVSLSNRYSTMVMAGVNLTTTLTGFTDETWYVVYVGATAAGTTGIAVVSEVTGTFPAGFLATYDYLGVVGRVRTRAGVVQESIQRGNVVTFSSNNVVTNGFTTTHVGMGLGAIVPPSCNLAFLRIWLRGAAGTNPLLYLRAATGHDTSLILASALSGSTEPSVRTVIPFPIVDATGVTWAVLNATDLVNIDVFSYHIGR